ncbi:hypothetical protein [Bacillus kwashiorkori]|uniref:hypothetical protein n=1 Tax=Bacillus kwashiorkori TaxID=1522318 RepID=UPI000782C943|nr:hypothetical protein [Bacillus kwashiorkori]
MAKQYLENSLERNLKISRVEENRYSPNPNSFLKNDVHVEFLDFIDDRVARTYPFVYNPPYNNIVERINGPSVIAVITTKSPRWFYGKETIIRQAAVYEYKK